LFANSTALLACPGGQHDECVLPRPWGGCAQTACFPDVKITNPLEDMKKAVIGLIAKPTADAVRPTAESKGWSMASCLTIGYTPIKLASMAYEGPICLTFNVGSLECVGFIESSTAGLVGSVCTLLCASHSLEGCK